MEEKPSSFQLRPPPPPDPLLPPAPFEFSPIQILACGLGMMLLVIAIVLFLSRSKKKAVSASARKVAYREALRTLNEAHPAGAREAATVSSLALRRFLAIAAGDPALYETHEEFVARRDSLAHLSESVRSSTVQRFDELAALKYGSQSEDHDPVQVIDSSRKLLETLNQAFNA
jgi:hypothetical protein